MINRIETIDDLAVWLRSLTELHIKNVSCQKLSDGRVSALRKAIVVLDELKAIYPDAFKQCIKCEKIYPATKEWFDWNGRGRDGLNSICKFCRNADQKKRKSKGRKSPYSSADQEELQQHFGNEVM